MSDATRQSTLGTFVHQELDFKASSERVYEALLDEKQFAAFSGSPAQIQREAGGAFSLVGGRVTGRNVELIPNQRIVQAWRVVPWESGIYSIARFELTSKGTGTRLVLDESAGDENIQGPLHPRRGDLLPALEQLPIRAAPSLALALDH